MNIKQLTLIAVTVMSAVTASAQYDVRSSSSQYLPAWEPADVSMTYGLTAKGVRYAPIWGLDQAWINQQNLKKGINHMGKENIGIGRSAFRFTKALTNDSVLSSDIIAKMRERASIFNQVSDTLPIVFTADQEAGTNEYFVKNQVADISHWAAMINSHVHWMQQNTKHPVVGVSPFNEGDYWTKEEGASPVRQLEVAKLLRKNPRFADIAIVGGNTLNNDKALSWYSSGKNYYEWGNTHQLAGSFDTFAKFYQQLQKDGKVGYGDEMHNVGEAMIGLEYGMTVGIWWGFDSRARGEFCQISRHGERLAYGEHRPNWTAASVWRHDDGRVKAFIGSSERQAVTTNYQFVSTEREVYYDGYGPVRELMMEMPGGTGYQNGQTNAERVIDVTWGEDVAPGLVNGIYKLVNKQTGSVVAYESNGNGIVLRKFSPTSKKQQWTVKPCSHQTGGDYSFYDIESVENSKIRINVRDYSTASRAELIAWTQDKPSSNEQWYLEYIGNGYYYLRNRESALYMTAATDAATARVLQTTMLPEANRDRMLFRFLPLDVDYETTAPGKPHGLTAEAHAASVKLTWDANTEEDLEGYMVLRALQGTDDWNTIARKLKVTEFTDNTCCQGDTYAYRVKAIDLAQNLSEASESISATPSGERSMIARWQMENNLYDDTQNMMDGAAYGSPAYVDGVKSGTKALRLSATKKQYVQLPYEVACSDELTVALWVSLRSTTAFQRIFDFGYDENHYLYLTPSNGTAIRLAMKNGDDEQKLDCSVKLPASQWKHVVVTIGGGKAVVYVDGQEVGSRSGITIRPSDIRPVLNYIGRGQLSTSPFLAADIDDVRIYNYAISADDVQTIMGGGELTGVMSAKDIPSVPHKIYGLDGVRRTEPRPGLNIIDGKKVLR